MFCFFCLKVTKNGISVHGVSELATHARNIITKYFWFDAHAINSPEKYACSNCWQKVVAFHEFYSMVESNYEHQSRSDETNTVVDAVFNCKTEIFIDETVGVKTEFGSTLDCISSNVEPLQRKVEISVTDDPFADVTASSAADQHSESTADSSLKIENKTKSKAQNPEAIPSKQTKTNKIATKRSTGEKTKRKPPRGDKTGVNSHAEQFECYICRKSFAKKNGIRGVQKHMHLHDPIESHIYECDLCGKKFSRKYILLSHLHYHQTKTLYNKKLDKRLAKTPCPICQKELTIKNLKAHIKSLHENKKKEKTHMCAVCNKVYSSPSALSLHAVTHEDFATSKIQCEKCGKWLKNKNNLYKHKLTHTKSPMQCPHCSLIAPNRHALRSHVSRVHTAKKYHCSICSRSFSRPIILREHEATHTGSMLYDCPYCSLKFRNNSNMATHIRGQHTSEWIRDREMKKIYGRC